MENEKSSQKKLVRRGSFRVAYNNEGKLVIGCVIAAVLCLFMMVIGLVMFGAPQDLLGFMSSVFWVIPAVISIICIPVITYGKSCSYTTDETEFVVSTNKGSEYLYYSEISDVIYQTMYRFGKERGLLVTVVTGIKDVTFRYIFDNEDLHKPEHTPFYLLELNAGLRQPEEEDPELATAIMSQFAVMKEKQEDRLSKKRPKKTWKNLFDD